MKQDEFTQNLKRIMQEYGEEYAEITEKLTKRILYYLDQGDSIAKAYSKARKDIDFYNLNLEAIEDAVYEAALKGYGINAPEVFAGVEGEAVLRHKLMDVAWAADKMKLSKRLHGVDNVLHNNIRSTVGNALKTYKTIKQTAMELYDGYNEPENVLKPAELSKKLQQMNKLTEKLYSGDKQAAKRSDLGKAISKDAKKIKTPALQAAYEQVADAATTDKPRALKKAKKLFEMGGSKEEIEKLLMEEREKAIKKALWVATQEKTRYYAERIARTEAARAYYEGQIAQAKKDPDVFGFQWVLSSAHGASIDCDCEFYAKVDIGYGPGIFPKDKVPFLPAHPNCMCHLRKIFVWEVVRTDGKDTLPERPQAANRVEEALKEVEKNGKINPPGAVYDNWKKLPAEEAAKPLEELLKRINPNYGNGNEYECNCQRCVTACELMFRGYDVKAKPCSDLKTDYIAANMDKVFVGAKYEGPLVGIGRNAATLKMMQWGNGSRGMVYIELKDANGLPTDNAHVFMAQNINGRVYFFDPQNAETNAANYFDDAVLNKARIMRIDDKEISDLAKECCYFQEE